MKEFAIKDGIELIRLGDFQLKHDTCPTGMIGGRYSYEFTPTTIGTFLVIKCTVCEEEKNITNCDTF